MTRQHRWTVQTLAFLLAVCLLLGIAPGIVAQTAAEDLIAPDRPPARTQSGLMSLSMTEVTMDRTRTRDDIVAKVKELPHSGFDTGIITRYEQAPRFTAPYEAGSLVQADIDDALNALKMVRYLAGLPYEDMAFTPELNSISQHGAVLLAASNQASHVPVKPDDMAQEFFDIAYRGCSEASVSAGVSNISASVLGFIADDGANNLEKAGHRRWILAPGGRDYGIGYARYAGSSHQGDRVSMYVYDAPIPWECEADTYIAWPSSGDFPIQYFVNRNDMAVTPDIPWSVNLGAMYAPADKADAILTLSRARDGKVWTFNASTPTPNGLTDDGGLYFAVDNEDYGIEKALLFRPDLASLGPILDGDVFTVSISGLKTAGGADAALTYSIDFFDLAKEMNRSRVNITVTDGATPVADAAVVIDGQTLTTDANGLATLRVNNNNSYNYTVSKDGYDTVTGSVSVGTDTVSAPVTLVPAGTVGPTYAQAFPDANFRQIVLALLNEDGGGRTADSIVTEADQAIMAGWTELHVGNRRIADLTGIAYFTGLTRLDCYNNQLTSLDVSRNTALEWLDCQNNRLTSLDVSQNTALTRLYCHNNQLTLLDVSGATALTTLACGSNQLASLDVSNNNALEWLTCSINQLTLLDVSGATALTTLACGSNQLASLDVSRNAALRWLSFEDNQLTSLDVSQNTALTYLQCTINQLTSLDVSNNTALTYFYCDSNRLTSLDVSGAIALTRLDCYDNQLTSLDVSRNTALTYLQCTINQLTSLDVSNNTALTYFYCDANRLTALDVSQNVALEVLFCHNNYIPTPDDVVGWRERGLTINSPQSLSSGDFRYYPQNTPVTYAVTVVGGTGGGGYAPGETVQLTADAPPPDRQFKNWTASPEVTFADPNSEETGFIMPASDVTVTANYIPLIPGPRLKRLNTPALMTVRQGQPTVFADRVTLTPQDADADLTYNSLIPAVAQVDPQTGVITGRKTSVATIVTRDKITGLGAITLVIVI